MRRNRKVAWILTLAVFGALGCTVDNPGAAQLASACEHDVDCQAASSGRCVPSPSAPDRSWCSYADPGCPNGRFASTAGDDLANLCVPDESATPSDMAVPQGCGAVGNGGVCRDNYTLVYCDGNAQLATTDCAATGQWCDVSLSPRCGNQSFACSPIQDKGACFGDVRQYCAVNTLTYQDCSLTSQHCVFDASAGGFSGGYVCKSTSAVDASMPLPDLSTMPPDLSTPPPDLTAPPPDLTPPPPDLSTPLDLSTPGNCGAVSTICSSNYTLTYCDGTGHLATTDCNATSKWCDVSLSPACATNSFGCSPIQSHGACFGNVLQYCVVNSLTYQDCSLSSLHCMFDRTAAGGTGGYVCK